MVSVTSIKKKTVQRLIISLTYILVNKWLQINETNFITYCAKITSFQFDFQQNVSSYKIKLFCFGT